MPRTLLVINPISGTRSKRGLEQAVNSRLRPLGHQIDTEYTRCHGDATRLARLAADSGYDIVLAAGGDGTVNEAAAALRHTSVTLGIIPCGSGNGLARHLGIPVDPLGGIDVVARCAPLTIDCGVINQQPFFCTCGVGFDAAVACDFAARPTRGLLTYLSSTVHTWRRYRPQTYTLVIDNDVVAEQALLIAVCNASQYGNNAYIAPHASVVDGLLDVTVIKPGPLWTTARAGLDIMAGSIRQTARIHTFRAQQLSIVRDEEGPAHIDGEPLTLPSRLDISCQPAALRVFAPAPDPRIKPVITPVTAALDDIVLALAKLLRR